MEPDDDDQEQEEQENQEVQPVRRGPGRPRGSRDFRPFIIDLVRRRHKTVAGALMRIEKLMSRLSPEKQVDCELRLLELALRGSPKTVQTQEVPKFSLIVEYPPDTLPKAEQQESDSDQPGRVPQPVDAPIPISAPSGWVYSHQTGRHDDDDTPPDPPRVRLLDPDGRPISFAPPDVPPVGPYGPHEIP